MTKKEHFQLMYDRLDVEHKGIKLNKVLCSLLMYIAGGDKNVLGNTLALSLFFRAFDVSELRTTKLKELVITFGRYPTRKDHRQLMEGIVGRLGEEVTYIDTSRWSARKLKISLTNIIRSLKLGLFGMDNVMLSFRQRILLSSQICFYLNTIDSLYDIEFSDTSRFLCLANTLDLENLLTQLFQREGIKTYSLMEGAYFIQDNDLPITNIAFDNLTSDFQLCWGQYSKDEFMKYGYSPDQLIVAGYPKKVEGKLMKQSNPLTKAVVLLSQYVMEEQNRNLLKILSFYSDKIDFSLKLHPSLDWDEYSMLASTYKMNIVPKELTINECVDNEKFNFAIAINSTTYYEALMRGLPCFRYYDGSYTPMAGCNDEFDSAESFERQVNRIKKLQLEIYQKEVDKVLEYAVGWGIDQYQRIFSSYEATKS